MDTKLPNVLIVDDGEDICQLLCDDLSHEGYRCSVALNGLEAFRQLDACSYDIVLLDIRLPDISGLEILDRIASSSDTIASIMITGVDSIATAVEAIKRGAADYIVKPFTLARVRTSIQKALKGTIHPKVTSMDDLDSSDCIGDDDLPWKEDLRNIDAIAAGVKARYDLMLGFFEIVINETAEIARQLDLPETVIQRWIEIRIKQSSERKRNIEYFLTKLEKSPAAQELLGLMMPYIYSSENNGKGN